MTTTTSDDATDTGFGAATEMFTRMWTDFASKMAASGMSMPGEPTPDMARQMRDAFFRSWSDACDRYMRSPEFMQMMRDSMKAAIDLRKQMVEQMGDLQHSMQGASRQDADRLLKSIENLEGRVNDTFDQVMANLDAINERVSAMEAGATRRKSAKTTTAKKKTTKKRVTKKKTSKKKAGRSSR